MYKYVLFDLDGTLTDPAIGITNSVMYALSKFGIEVQQRSSLYKFIGPPLVYSFKTFYGFTEEEAVQALGHYRVRFQNGGIFENEIYEGIPELLRQLKETGCKIILATSKPEEFAVEILKHFNIMQYFTFIAGNTLDEKRPEKEAVIKHVLANIKGITSDNAVMVGDRSYDVLGAAKFGIPCVGVSYGFGGRKELEKSGAVAVVDDVFELRSFLINAE